MKKLLFLMCFMLVGCATMFPDVKADKYIKEGKIYVGMSKQEFWTLMPEPKLGKMTKTTTQGTEEIWAYDDEDYPNWEKSYTFYFDRDGKLTSWETE